MFFGYDMEKFLLLLLVAALLLGPERLPRYAEAFARFVKQAGDYLRGARDRMREEVGPEIDELDWRKLDPRQYDPRRIIRDALMDDSPSKPAAVIAEPSPSVTDDAAPAAPAATAPVGTGSAAALLASATAMNAAAQAGAEKAVSLPPSFSAEEPPPYDSEAT